MTFTIAGLFEFARGLVLHGICDDFFLSPVRCASKNASDEIGGRAQGLINPPDRRGFDVDRCTVGPVGSTISSGLVSNFPETNGLHSSAYVPFLPAWRCSSSRSTSMTKSGTRSIDCVCCASEIGGGRRAVVRGRTVRSSGCDRGTGSCMLVPSVLINALPP